MNRSRFVLSLLLTSAWLGAAGYPANAARLVALAPDEELYTDVFPNSPVIATQPGGPYVISWDDDTFAPREGTFFYRHTPAGADTAAGEYHSIYSPTDIPSVEAVTAGRQGFDVIWHTWTYPDGKPFLFYRTHLDLQGQPVGKTIHLGGTGTDWVWQVRGNGFMAGRSLPGQHGIAAQRLAASGQGTGAELRLNSRPVDHPTEVSVVGLADASFVAVWLGNVPGHPRTATLRARRFSPSGKPLAPDFDVNALPLEALDSSFSHTFKVAAAPSGGFAVAWMLQQKTYLRRFNAAGTPLSSEVLALTSSDPKEEEALQSMAFNDAGDLVLLWESQLRLFDPQGRPQGSPVAVNSDDTEIPQGGSLAWTGDSWLVTWVAAIPPYDQSGIFVREFVKR